MNRGLVARIALVACLCAGMLPLVASTSSSIEVPRTMHARIGISAAGSGAGEVRSLPFAATHLGFSWPAGAEAPEVRTSEDGQGWSGWTRLEAAEDLSDPEAGVSYSSLLPGGGARYLEVRGPAAAISVINTRDGPRQTVRVERSAAAATPGPVVVSRAEWGADESLRKVSPSFARVRRLFVHHTVTANDDPDPAGTIRAIYAYHTQSRGWDDIGYNFLIDSQGRVYEGRYARAYAPGETPSGESANGLGPIGAHVAGFNTGSAGIALLGDFRSVSPRAAAVEALVGLIAWKADRHGIDPRGSHDGLPNLAGHRDAGTTDCPGDRLYDLLPSVRDRAEERIATLVDLSPPSMPTATELNPGNVSKDVTPAAGGAVGRSAVRVDLVFDAGEAGADRVVSVAPQGGSFTVGDADYGGVGLALGTYAVRSVSVDAQGRASTPAPVADHYAVTTGDVPTGYWVMGSDGGIFAYGQAGFHGSTGGIPLNSPAVGLDATPAGKGYWMVAADGGVFAFGDAGFSGSTGGIRLNRPIVDMAASPAGAGYWMVASDGGIFAFGAAPFHGSTGSLRLNSPIAGIAPTPTGGGYWMVAADGGVFAFGDAGFFGSTGSLRLAAPIVGMAATPTGAGYWLAGADGGIFAFGDAGFFGSVPGVGIRATASRIAPTATGRGYYVVTRGGSVHAFGDAPGYGSPSASGLRIIALDLATAQ